MARRWNADPHLGRSGVRAREWGLCFGDLEPGEENAVTDVPGVRVGHVSAVTDTTLSGVTAVFPSTRNLVERPARAGFFAGNGFGKVVGTTQILELGLVETPLLLTGTLSTFRVADTLVEWVLKQPGNERIRSVNPVVAETNDNWWSDGPHAAVVTAQHVHEALMKHQSGVELEGCVGAGTGTVAFGYKSGIGSASRLLCLGGQPFVLGVLVQANHGGRLPGVGALAVPGTSAGSIVVVLVTDAPLDARQLGRMARRGVYALGRTGADFAGGSGDYAFALSTVQSEAPVRVPDCELDPLWIAVQDVVDEAVWNSLVSAVDATRGVRTYRAIRRRELVNPVRRDV